MTMIPGRGACQIFLLFLLALHGPLCCYGECCPDGWLSFQNSCYLFSNAAGIHYTEAEHYFRQHGAHLVNVETKAEDLFLKDFLARLNGQDYWIGLTDEIIEGIWMWSSSGAQANYTDWGPGEPNSNHGNQDCAFYHSGEQYMWADIACSSTDFRPLCEKSKNVFLKPNIITG